MRVDAEVRREDGGWGGWRGTHRTAVLEAYPERDKMTLWYENESLLGSDFFFSQLVDEPETCSFCGSR